MSLINEIRVQMNKTVAALQDDLRTIRPSRASADLIGTMQIEIYGQKLSLNQLATITVSDDGGIIITPWDRNNLGSIEENIRKSALGFSIINEGQNLRLTLPPLTQERRTEFVKLVSQKGEAARISLRQLRQNAIQELNQAKKTGQIREDEVARSTKQLNDLIDEFNGQIKSLIENKEKELLT